MNLSPKVNKPDWITVSIVFLASFLVVRLLTQFYISLIGGTTVLAYTPSTISDAFSPAISVTIMVVAWRWMPLGIARRLLFWGAFSELVLMAIIIMANKYVAIHNDIGPVHWWYLIAVTIGMFSAPFITLGYINFVKSQRI